MVARLRRARRRATSFARALDLGCGVGEWTIEYASIAERVIGVDVNPAFIDRARRRAVDESLADRVDFHVSAIESWDDWNDVDLICAGACLMYVEDDAVRALCARAARVLPSHGLLYVRATVPTAFSNRGHDGFGHYRTRERYEDWFARHGFSVIDRGYSAGVVADGVADWGIRPLTGLARAAALVARAERTLRRQNDYCNWILRPSASHP